MKTWKIMSIVFAAAVAVSGCKREGDVLASYNGGQITRGDFYEWMEARRMSKDSILKKVAQQKTHLERFATEKLLVREAKNASFDANEEFLYLKNHAVRNFYSQYMSRQISTRGKFSEKAAKARIIKLTAKNFKLVNNKRQKLSDAEMNEALNEKMEKAKTLIAELDKGEPFDELAKKNSDDFSKRKGGDIGYIIAGMRGEDFSKAVFNVKEKTYTKVPVIIGNAVYIIQVDEVVNLTEDNIDDVIDDKVQQMGLKRRLLYNSSQGLQERLIKAEDVVNNVDTVHFYNPADLIFKVGESEFRVADLNRLVNFILKKRRGMGRPDMVIEDKIKRELARRILREEVLMREAKKKGIDKEEKFKKELAFFVDYNIAGTYESEVVLADITVTPQDVRDYYTKNLDKMYTRNLNEGGKSVKKVIPFDEVRKSIEARLVDMKRSEKRKAWVDELLKKNNFKINDSELSGD